MSEGSVTHRIPLMVTARVGLALASSVLLLAVVAYEPRAVAALAGVLAITMAALAIAAFWRRLPRMVRFSLPILAIFMVVMITPWQGAYLHELLPPERVEEIPVTFILEAADQGTHWRIVESLEVPQPEANADVHVSEAHSDAVSRLLDDGWHGPQQSAQTSIFRRDRRVTQAHGPLSLRTVHEISVALPTGTSLDVGLKLFPVADSDSKAIIEAPERTILATNPSIEGRALVGEGSEQVVVPLGTSLAAHIRATTNSRILRIDTIRGPLALTGIGPWLARLETGSWWFLPVLVFVALLGLIVSALGKAAATTVAEKILTWLKSIRATSDPSAEPDSPSERLWTPQP